MQDTRYTLKLADEDKRWMSLPGLADSDSSQLKSFVPERLTDPAGADAATAPSLELGIALAGANAQIYGLTQEQARLRESLDTLNGTLLSLGTTLTAKAGEAVGATAQGASKEKSSSDDSWVTQGAKWLGTGLAETARSRAAGNFIDSTVVKIPYLGKVFADGKKGGDCCCPGTAPPERGRDRFGPKNPKKSKSTGRPEPAGSTKNSTSSKSSSKSLSARMAKVRSFVTQAGSTVFGPKTGFHAGASDSITRQVSPPVPGGPKAATAGVLGKMASLGSTTARRLGPLRYADTALNLVQGVRQGDVPAIATGLATAGGAWAGASVGAALGTLVFPGVGTAIGGAIGGLAGSEAGAWLGEKLFGSSDRLSSPEAVSQELNSARSDNVQITVAPSIQITGINPADAQQVVEQVIQAMQTQCVPMMTDSLGIRRNAALADQRGD
ncbi:MAG: hypothetical protein GAK37_02264 [Pseudomonas sp.]|nr:MAG: hypothetical protein GAK37_02264 [Pseudomonas sp.]